MFKSMRFVVAALMMMGLVSVSSGAKAQATGGVSLLDPTTAPIVGGVVGALVADSGLTNLLFSNVLNPSTVPDLGNILGLTGPGSVGVISFVPGASILEPIALPLLAAVNQVGLPLLDPARLNGAGGASAQGGLPLIVLSAVPLVGDLSLALTGSAGPDAGGLAGLPIVGPVLTPVLNPVLGLVGGVLGGGR